MNFCLSCRLNELIPDLSAPQNIERWYKLEMAKRRILYTILRLRLPIDGTGNRPSLRFKFVADVPGQPSILTGYANGLITINAIEADDAERERRRVNLHEPYRTLLGHLRHEIAHYYWDRLIANSQWLQGFRNLFGDETADYAAALENHYNNGAPLRLAATPRAPNTPHPTPGKIGPKPGRTTSISLTWSKPPEVSA